MKLKFAIGLFIIASLNVCEAEAGRCGKEFSTYDQNLDTLYHQTFPKMYSLLVNAKNSESLIDAALSMDTPSTSIKEKINIVDTVTEQFQVYAKDADDLNSTLSSASNNLNNARASLQDCLNIESLQRCDQILKDGYEEHSKLIRVSKDEANKDASSFKLMSYLNTVLSTRLSQGITNEIRTTFSETKSIAHSIQNRFTSYKEIMDSSTDPRIFEREMAECLNN